MNPLLSALILLIGVAGTLLTAAARDYYSMVAIFNPLKRPQNGRTELTLPTGRALEIAAASERDQKINELRRQTNTLSAAEIEQHVQKLRDATPDLPQAYFLHEPSPDAPPTHVLLRGSPARRGTVVSPAVPAVLAKHQPEFPSAGSRTSQRRLGLARWLAGTENPLTARVIVNRVWQQHLAHEPRLQRKIRCRRCRHRAHAP